ncbi:MAG: hypothetical protein AAF957_19345 [Planctomycetota bacterium]
MHADALRFTLSAASLALLGACASTAKAPLTALDAPADLPIDYSAKVAPGVWRFETPVLEGDLTTESADPAALESGPFIEIDASFTPLTLDQVEELFGHRRVGPWAVTVSRTAGRRVLAELGAAPAHSQIVVVADGQKGDVAIVNQVAYIERFDVESTSTATIGDPIIGVASDGIEVTFVGRIEGDRIALEIELAQSELQRPIQEVDVQLPGALNTATIHQPVTSQQNVKITPTVDGRTDVLIGVPLAGESRDILVGRIAATVRTAREGAATPGAVND